MSRSRTFFGLASLALVAAGAVACDMPPRGPVDLREARVLSVHLSEESGRTSMCPGTDVPLLIDVDARVPGESGPVRLHSRREVVDDWIFDPQALHLSSHEGTLDENAVFHAEPDPRVSAAEGFLVDVHAPGGPSFGLRFVPSYDCIKEVGKHGVHGLPGADGEDALGAGSTVGVPGEEGSTGGPGGVGPHLDIYVTWVRTAYSAKLLGIVSDGGMRGISLAPPDGSIVLDARGGDGGQGGRGGRGGGGSTRCVETGRRGHCTKTVSEPTGNGGMGGAGGTGGPGGDLTVHIDARYPEIRDHLVLDARGGAGGEGGYGGPGGDPIVSYNYSGVTGAGSHGSPGGAGASGQPGPNGTARVLLDNVGERFAGMPAIQEI